MDGHTPDLIELARLAQHSSAPLRELTELLLRARARAQPGARATAVERLLAVAPDLAREQAWAAEMQLGAEGFDNTAHARAYRDVQDCLVQAGHQLARACEVLLDQERS
jgi:hypothetical protein